MRFLVATVMAAALAAKASTLAPSTNLLPRPITPTNHPAAGFTPTNVLVAEPSAPSPAGANDVIPLIEFSDVPLSTAIENLARCAQLNYLVAPRLVEKWKQRGEPAVNLKVRDVTAKAELKRMLGDYHLVLSEDSVSTIAFVVPAGEADCSRFASLSATAASADTKIIPLIQFSEVPMTTAIRQLARQAGVPWLLDPRVAALWDGSSQEQLEPMISLRLENVTALGTLHRLLNLHGLVLVKNPATEISRITFEDSPQPIIDANLADLMANSPTGRQLVLQFSDEPLDSALVKLAGQTGCQMEFDARILASGSVRQSAQKHGILVVNHYAASPLRTWFDPMPTISGDFQNILPAQALVALCDNYGLTVAKDAATGIMEIKPREIKRHHHMQLRYKK